MKLCNAQVNVQRQKIDTEHLVLSLCERQRFPANVISQC